MPYLSKEVAKKPPKTPYNAFFSTGPYHQSNEKFRRPVERSAAYHIVIVGAAQARDELIRREAMKRASI